MLQEGSKEKFKIVLDFFLHILKHPRVKVIIFYFYSFRPVEYIKV